MSDENALLAAIAAHPLDDTPRLVFADWLDERGDPADVAKAEFIRVQCELAQLPASDPRYPALVKREKALLTDWRKVWTKPLKKYATDVNFWCGFPMPSLANLSVKQLAELMETDLQAAPLWRYHYGMRGRELNQFLRVPQLHRITTLCLRPPGLPKGLAKKIAKCEGLRNVTELVFIDCPITADDLKLILDSWTGRRLTSLWVNECAVEDAGMRLIASHPATNGLRLLRAHTASFTSRAVKAIVDNPNLDRVSLATFAHNTIGDTGAKHLLRWKALDGIRELYLMNTGMSAVMRRKFRERLGDRVTL